jgi:hypothetical protein
MKPILSFISKASMIIRAVLLNPRKSLAAENKVQLLSISLGEVGNLQSDKLGFPLFTCSEQVFLITTNILVDPGAKIN